MLPGGGLGHQENAGLDAEPRLGCPQPCLAQMPRDVCSQGLFLFLWDLKNLSSYSDVASSCT